MVSAVRSGGGLSTGAIVGLAGAGAAAAGGFLARPREDTTAAQTNAAPQLPGILFFPSPGLLHTTTSFSHLAIDTDGDALTFAWEFGDGAMSSLERPTHVYSSEGSFTVRLTVRDATHSATTQAVLIIKSMTGRWTLGTTSNFYELTQSGSTITGTFNSPGVPPRGPVSGTVGPTSPAVTLSESIVALNGVFPFTFRGDPTTTADQITGEFNNGVSIVPGGLTRR